MLKVEHINYAYGNVQVLFDVNLQVPKGSVVCLMGRNGVGKTTLVKTLVGLLKPLSGDILFNDQNVTRQAAYRRARKGIGYVPQGRHIFPRLTVEENLHTGLRHHRQAIPENIFEYFPVLKDMQHRMGGDLSGGQQQQLAIARALVLDPDLLILDEPTEGLQPNIIQRIGEVIQQISSKGKSIPDKPVERRELDILKQIQDTIQHLATEGKTILIVEQYLDFIKSFCDQFVLLNRGRVVAVNTLDGLTDTLVAKYLHV